MEREMTMVERVAKAIAAKADSATPWEDCGQGFKEICIEFAEAAIEAMREPTEMMVIAGCHHENMGDMAGRWNAMIDAALKEHEGEKE